MILKEIKPGQYMNLSKSLREVKVERLRADAKRFVDDMYMELSDDPEFVEETRNEPARGTDNVIHMDFSHVSEGAFGAIEVKIPRALTKLIFLKQVDQMNRRLI